LVVAEKFHKSNRIHSCRAHGYYYNFSYVLCDGDGQFQPVAGSPVCEVRRLGSRGFDQSKLIAKSLARGRYKYSPLLRRLKKIHQIGANKKQRQEQLAGAFMAVNKYLIKNAKILLVDDVATTGASLEEAARTLKKAGAKEVSAVVFART
jgi:ComF family protein